MEFNIQSLIGQVSVLLPIIVALIAYNLGQRGNKINRILTQADTNLTNICGPMHLRLEEIFEKSNKKEVKNLLEEYFTDYSSINFPVHQLANLELVEWYFKTEKMYLMYKDDNSNINWERFWEELHYLRKILKDEYYNNFSLLYNEYRWVQHNLHKNIFIRILIDLFRLSKDFLVFMILISFLGVYFGVVNLYSEVFPQELLLFSILMLIGSVILYGAALIINSHNITLQSQKKSNLESILKKLRLWNLYESKILKSSKIKIEIPRNPK